MIINNNAALETTGAAPAGKESAKDRKQRLQSARKAKAEQKLAEWISAAARAVKKVQEYTRKVAYYNRVMAEDYETRPKKPRKKKPIRKFDFT
jgi:hypothetical protein